MQIVLPLRQWSRSPLNPVDTVISCSECIITENEYVTQMSAPTFIVKRAIKVIAASVEASGKLYEVASPGVAGSGETGQSHQSLSTSR